MNYERTITLQDPPQRALQRSARALQLAGYKRIETDAGAMMVRSAKLRWSPASIPATQRSTISITLVPGTGSVEATILGTDGLERANLLTGSSPTKRAVDKVVDLLEAEEES